MKITVIDTVESPNIAIQYALHVKIFNYLFEMQETNMIDEPVYA